MPLDKSRKIGTGRLMGSTTASRGTGFAAVNNKQEVAAAAGDFAGTEGLECGTVEFTKDEVDALMNEKIKAKRFDLKVCFIVT